MKKNISVLCCLFLLSTTSLFADNSLTLGDALKFAISNNELINASAKTKDFCEYKFKVAKGKYLPNIFIDGYVNKINESIVLGLNSARTAVIEASVATLKVAGKPENSVFLKEQLESKIPNFDMKFQDDLFYKFSAGFTWPLFTGGKISANTKAKEIELSVSQLEYEKTLNSTITSVIESYFRAKLAQEARNIRKDYLDDIIQHNDNAQKLFNVGMISKTNKLRSEVALAQATREYQKSQRDLELALVVLSDIIGVDVKDSNLITNFKKIDNIKDTKYYEDTAISNNIALKNLKHKKEMISQKKKAIKGNFLPTIATFGKYEIYKHNLTLFEPEWVAGLSARLDLFKGGQDYNEFRAYNTQLEIIDLYIQNANKMVITAIKKYHHKAKTALEQYESLKSSQELTEENLNLYKKSFTEGLATSIEVLDAELALEKVRLEQSQALFDFNVAYAHLIDLCANSQLLMNKNIGESKKNEK